MGLCLLQAKPKDPRGILYWLSANRQCGLPRTRELNIEQHVAFNTNFLKLPRRKGSEHAFGLFGCFAYWLRGAGLCHFEREGLVLLHPVLGCSWSGLPHLGIRQYRIHVAFCRTFCCIVAFVSMQCTYTQQYVIYHWDSKLPLRHDGVCEAQFGRHKAFEPFVLFPW